MEKGIGAITLFVQDAQRSKEFYGRAFAADVEYEDEVSVVVALDNLVLNLLQRGDAVDGLMGPIPAASPGANLLFTVWVDDADATCATLTERGVELADGPRDRAWGKRTAAFLDPDGYAWEVAANI